MKVYAVKERKIIQFPTVMRTWNLLVKKEGITQDIFSRK